MLRVRIFSGGCRGRVAAKILVSEKNITILIARCIWWHKYCAHRLWYAVSSHTATSYKASLLKFACNFTRYCSHTHLRSSVCGNSDQKRLHLLSRQQLSPLLRLQKMCTKLNRRSKVSKSLQPLLSMPTMSGILLR